MQIKIPNLSFVTLVGPSGSGKSTFARKHFRPTEVLLSDACRGLVCDDENDQAVTNEAFDLLHFIARKRLALGHLTVVESEAEGTRWWLDLTEGGGEGMVVKPHQFVVKGKKGLVQPAVKCRGREYLRIIYGPEYTFPENLTRLRERGLMTKRSLALREFALGIEALERFVRCEPLRRVHECVFGGLALESEPVDPRL